MKMAKKISFIGFGRMGSALIHGAMEAGLLTPRQVVVFDPDSRAIKAAKKAGFSLATSESDAANRSDFVFLCVKPQQMPVALKALSQAGTRSVRKKVFVSIAAGIKIRKIEAGLGGRVAVIRVMPNTPAMMRSGVSAVSRGRWAGRQHEKWVTTLLNAVGKTVSVQESMMDAVTAVSGSGPAYVFYLAEAMMSAAKKLGLKGKTAETLVRETIFGSGVMLRCQDESPQVMRKHVTSPGGTTAAAVNVFDRKNLKELVGSAIVAACKRSKFLSRV